MGSEMCIRDRNLPTKNKTGTQVLSESRKAMKLLDRIERHLKESHMSATRFGRRAVGDPRFVLDLRAGRRPRRRTIEKVEYYLKTRNPLQ